METRYFRSATRYFTLCGLLLILLLAGCKTNFRQSPAISADPQKAAMQHLEMANSATSPPIVLEHRLLATNFFIQAGKIEEAQRILRETRNAEQVDPAIHRAILATRLALLHKDITSARSHLKTALDTISQYTHSNLTSTLNPGSGTQQIALLLPAKGPHAAAAKIVKDGFLAAYYQAKQNQSSAPSVKIIDTSEQSIPEAYQKALADHATIIVGPLTKPDVQAIAKLSLDIPVLALNTIAEDNSFPRKLYQFGLMPEDEVVAVAEKALRQGHRRTLILAPQNEWGQRLSDTFKQFWTSRNAQVIDIRLFKSPQELESKIKSLLQVKGTSRRTDADMIFIAANHELARQIKPILNFYYAEKLPVYGTSAIYSGNPMPNKDQDLNGVHFCDMPWILPQTNIMQETHSTLQKQWPNSVNQSPRFFALGMDAYLLATQLENAQGLSSRRNSGFTGELELNNYQRIQRGLVCARFEEGVPVPD